MKWRHLLPERLEPKIVDVWLNHFCVNPDNKWHEKHTSEANNIKAKKTVWCGLWESTQYPQEFVTILDEYYDEIISASSFLKTVKGSKTPFAFGGLHYIHDAQYEMKESKNKDVVTYYSITHHVVRKNVRQAIRCFCEAFTANDKVEYLIKLTDRSRKDAAGYIADLRSTMAPFDNSPRIVLLFGEVTDEEIQQFHYSCDIYYQIQHSEGWGVPQIDALNHGNPLVTNNFSAVGEYANDKNSFLIPYEVDKTSRKTKSWTLTGEAFIYGEKGQEWAYMNDEDIVDSLRKSRYDYKQKQNIGPSIDLSLDSCIEKWKTYLELEA